MRKAYFKLLGLLLFLFLAACGSGGGTSLPSSGISPPALTGYTGNMTNGSSITISGSSFGTKLTGAPQRWDNFESGTVGAIINGNNPIVGEVWSDWVNTSSRPTYGTGMLRTNSTRSAQSALTGESTQCLQHIREANPEWYFTYWYYFDQADSERQSKPWILYGSSNDEPIAYAGWGQVAVDQGIRMSFIDGGSALTGWPPAYDGWWAGPDVTQARNRWIRIEVYLKESSGANVQDASYRMWTYLNNGSPPVLGPYRYPKAVSRTGSGHWRQLMIGPYKGGGPATLHVYMDDIYIDSTQARVEICDTATWAARTKCEIQIPSAWSTTSITATVNRGSFGATDNAYLYIVDSNGDANNNGYAITFGD